MVTIWEMPVSRTICYTRQLCLYKFSRKFVAGKDARNIALCNTAHLVFSFFFSNQNNMGYMFTVFIFFNLRKPEKQT